MFQFYFQQGARRRKPFRVTSVECTIGSARQNDLVLPGRHLAKRHVKLSLQAGGVHITDLGSSSGTWVNRKRVREFGPLSEFDEVLVGDVSLWIDTHDSPAPSSPDSWIKSSGKAGTDSTAPPVADEFAQGLPGNSELVYWGGIAHEQLLRLMDLRRKDVNRMSDEQLRKEALLLLDEVVSELSPELPPTLDIESLRASVINEAIGLGPLERYLEDEEVSEIMVNSHREIFLEKAGKMQKAATAFTSEQAVYAVIERIITPLGRRIDESSPIVDARLKDGSRVNAVIPPLAIKGPSLTIRKFPRQRLAFSDLLACGSVSRAMVEFMRVCVQSRKNVVVSGGTGSGKTTLLNLLSNFIPDSERIVTIEDAAELQLVQPNLVALESRPVNSEGKGAVSIRELVRNSLRMRPDRIVIGECRGGEAMDMLQAMNTGHDGSLTTLHANNPRDVVSRLEVLVLMAGLDLPVHAIREQIASAVDIVIQQTRFPCGTRLITKVTEIVGLESGTVQLQDIFEFRQAGSRDGGRIQGQFRATGFIPDFYDALRVRGVPVDISIFQQGEH